MIVIGHSPVRGDPGIGELMTSRLSPRTVSLISIHVDTEHETLESASIRVPADAHGDTMRRVRGFRRAHKACISCRKVCPPGPPILQSSHLSAASNATKVIRTNRPKGPVRDVVVNVACVDLKGAPRLWALSRNTRSVLVDALR